MYQRPIFRTLFKRFNEPRHFIQVLAGPRQVGKTTLARQLIKALPYPAHFGSADEPSSQTTLWIEQQWEIGRLRARDSGSRQALLILDEVQKIPGWSGTVKRLWDEDSADSVPLHILVTGSSPLLVQKGLTESLAGRFELIPVMHWSFAEMKEAFDWTIEQYVYFGGYPGAVPLIDDEPRWTRYILDSLVETAISRDILLMTQVNKPALLRRLFYLGCEYSGQILSYQKMLGQLQDAGNTTTLAHYLDLLSGAGMVTSIHKYAGEQVRKRASSPKLQVFNTALLSTHMRKTYEQIRQDGQAWGRLVESSVGAHLVNEAIAAGIQIYYWRDRNREVDFIMEHGDRLIALEVKSTMKKTALSGMQEFTKRFRMPKSLLVGGHGLPLEEFLGKKITYWFD